MLRLIILIELFYLFCHDQEIDLLRPGAAKHFHAVLSTLLTEALDRCCPRLLHRIHNFEFTTKLGGHDHMGPIPLNKPIEFSGCIRIKIAIRQKQEIDQKLGI